MNIGHENENFSMVLYNCKTFYKSKMYSKCLMSLEVYTFEITKYVNFCKLNFLAIGIFKIHPFNKIVKIKKAFSYINLKICSITEHLCRIVKNDKTQRKVS